MYPSHESILLATAYEIPVHMSQHVHADPCKGATQAARGMLQVFEAQSFYEADPELGTAGGPPLAPTGMLGKPFKPVNRIYWCRPALC